MEFLTSTRHKNKKASYIARLCLLVCFFFISLCSEDSGLPAQSLVVDNVGYKPDAPKLAFVTGAVQPSDSFEVKNEVSETVFKEAVKVSLQKDPSIGEAVHVLDFTEFNKTGTYHISIPGKDYKEVPFQISDDVYSEVLNKTIESFYYQRCGTVIAEGSRWEHATCHLDDAIFYSNRDKQKDVTGGWHDAGDYGKYSVNTAVSLAFLLKLYDQKSQAFTDGQFDIPENSNGIPDLLDEAAWALRWLLKMQRTDGAVYHKVQKKKWTGEYLPQNDPDTRFIYEVSSTATADVAAVAALGARLFEPFDITFSKSLAQAAQKAWSFLKRNPGMVPKGGFQNPEDVKGGEYSDHEDTDERLWAAVELYRLTGEQQFHKYFLDHYTALGGPNPPPVSWKNVEEMGYYSYLDIPAERQEPEAREYLTRKLMKYADSLVKRVARHAYRVVLNKDEYYWGSNSVILGYAFDLVQAYELTGMELYREAALDQLHYILGRNPIGIAYVTGIGKNSVQNPYHQLSMKINSEQPVPGMVVGGPNNHNQLNGESLSGFPAKSYEDNEKNYMVNEVAINYTAPLVYVSGYFFEAGSASFSSINQQ